ncbi:alkylation response protein AidB-like acyl-CoA dehydrogenase [Mycobacterium sp. OAS707]|uniref:acyl-CoA dehydrogenase family protein n=1 Tax=Mycobacterium sp. OAS707 TaxID=2663822 RepID=UPI001789B3C8|nr:alkylation response protein AidB-like acyl-CoA dehydrogenase [Mycobacterium sp. OAS707]
MDLQYPPELRKFRDEVRSWLGENAPRDERPGEAKAIREYDLAWQRTQWMGGWAGIDWPTEYGGRGLTLLQQLIWHEEYARCGLEVMDSCFVGLRHAGPTLIAMATEEQKRFHLPKILRGESLWCQGFSEPGAGSDLAALSTRATVDGDAFIVNGQKIWTSFADMADYQELLVRTGEPDSKHRGITWVICDMHSPGVEVRPIETIDGAADFCEVFYDNVRIPLSNVVGEINSGWAVAMSTLSFERGTAFTANQVTLAVMVEELIALASGGFCEDGSRAVIEDRSVVRRLATARAEVASLRAMTYAGICRNLQADTPGPEGSMLKLYYADLVKEVTRLALDILGPEMLQYPSNTLAGNWTGRYLWAFAQGIGGGTSEIQRNIIGDRVLGLPR